MYASTELRFKHLLHIYSLDRGPELSPAHQAILFKLYMGETLTAKSNNEDMRMLVHIAERLREIEHYCDRLPREESKINLTIDGE